MHYILSIIRISLIVFLLTNKTTRGNMNDLFNQFLVKFSSLPYNGRMILFKFFN